MKHLFINARYGVLSYDQEQRDVFSFVTVQKENLYHDYIDGNPWKLITLLILDYFCTKLQNVRPKQSLSQNVFFPHRIFSCFFSNILQELWNLTPENRAVNDSRRSPCRMQDIHRLLTYRCTLRKTNQI